MVWIESSDLHIVEGPFTSSVLLAIPPMHQPTGSLPMAPELESGTEIFE